MTAGADTKSKLKVGSPIVIVEAPVMLKTAASVPSLRHNSGQVKAGDVGRYILLRAALARDNELTVCSALMLVLVEQDHGAEAQGRLGRAARRRLIPAGRQVFQSLGF